MDEKKIHEELSSTYKNLAVLLRHIERLLYSLFISIIIMVFIVSVILLKVVINNG